MKNPVTILCMSVLSLALWTCSGPPLTETEHVQRGQEFFAKGDYRSAQIEYKNALIKNPANVQARYQLGLIYLVENDGAGAEKELLRAKSAGHDNVRLVLAQAYLLQGKNQRVLDELDPALETEPPKQAESYVLRGEAYLGMRDQTNAKKQFESGLHAYARSMPAIIGLARIAVMQSEVDSAQEWVQRALAIDEKELKTWVLRGDIAMLKGDFRQAEESFGRVVQAHQGPVSKELILARTGLIRALLAQDNLAQAKSQSDLLLNTVKKHPLPHHLRGLIAYLEKDYDSAATHLSNALSLSPDYYQSVLLLGVVHYAQRRWLLAERYLSRFVDKVPKHALAVKLLADTEIRLQQPKEALSRLNTVVGADSKDSQLLSLIGAAAIRTGDIASAKGYLLKARDVDPDNPEIRTELALAYLAEEKTDAAIAELQQAIHKDERKARAQKLLILTLLKKRDLKRAEESAQLLVERFPQDAVARQILGHVYRVQKKIDLAREQWEQALKISEEFSPAQLALAYLDFSESHFDSAAQRLETVLQKIPKYQPAILLRAEVARRQNDISASLKWLRNACEISDKALAPRLALAKLYLSAKDFPQAKKYAMEAESISPDQPAVSVMLGAISMAERKYEQAESYFNKVPKKSPEAAGADYQLAQIKIFQGQENDALVLLDKALKTDAGYVPALALKAGILLRRGRTAQALQIAENLKKAQPQSPFGFALEGDLYYAQGKFPKAAVAYTKAYAFAPTEELLVKLYQTYRKAGQIEPAMALLQKWLADNPRDAGIWVLLAEAYQSNGQIEQAVNGYEKVLTMDENNFIALNNLAWLLHTQNNAQALHYAQRALEIHPDSAPVLDTVGWILLNQQDASHWPKAMEYLQRANEKLPEVAEIQYHLAMAIAKTGDKFKAKTMLRGLLANGKDFQGRAEAEALVKTL